MCLKAFRFRTLFYAVCVFAAFFAREALGKEGFYIINSYENTKPYLHKASLHNHSGYHPEWTHAPRRTDLRLLDYRDRETDPPYGIVSITEHTRITAPWNTVPPGIYENEAPWGVEGILWLPGNESVIGSRRQGGVFGELLIIGASTEKLPEENWRKDRDHSARSGWIYSSAAVPASIEFNFTGTGFDWIARKCPDCGIASVYIDGEKIGEADLFSPEIAYQETVFSVSGLESGEHSVRLAYDRKGGSSRTYMAFINLDALLITAPGGNMVEYFPRDDRISYSPYRYKHVSHPGGAGASGVEESLRALFEDGCFLVLAHPNSNLETSGEHKGKQLWTSTGYTYCELDMIFGGEFEKTRPLDYLPHALEVGNQAYDFTARSGYQNAEEKWDYLLGQGHRIMGIASDDSHGITPFGGWIVVYANAKDGEYLVAEDVMDSLFKGQFYASQGPNIERIEVLDGVFFIEADKPSLIEFISREGVVQSEENVLASSYEIKGNELYVRARVVREDESWNNLEGGGIGRMRAAWTNPVYVIQKAERAAESDNWLERRNAVETVSCRYSLESAAMNDENHFVRLAAAARIKDEDALERIVLRDSNWLVRREAVKEINCQDLLASVALRDRNALVSYAAAGRLVDESLLSDIARGAPFPGARLLAAERVADQNLLSDIALGDENWAVRRAAAGRLIDQESLKHIALSDRNPRVRVVALKGIKDQHFLGRMAFDDRSGPVRAAAAEMLTDPVVISEAGPWLHPELTGSLTDQALLREIALGAPEEAVRAAAVERITDRGFMDQIVMADPSGAVRRTAAARMQNDRLLARVVLGDPEEEVRAAALGTISDPDIFRRTVEKTGYKKVHRISSAIEIDGDLDDWLDMPHMPIVSDRADGITAKIFTGWDDDYFYLAASVSDENHHNNRVNGRIWDGDCLQFAFVPTGGAEPFNLGLALASGNVRMHKWLGGRIGLIASSEHAVSRDESDGKTYYELRIPFSKLGINPLNGSIFRFNAVIFDDRDGLGQDYWIQLTPGIAGGWNPGKFKYFILVT